MAYVDFADYLKIITRADNWKEIFRDIFFEQELISAKFKELNPIRNKIAHSRDLTEQDLRRLRIHAEDILLSLEKVKPSLTKPTGM
jgi:Swt1-like HEPN